MAHLVSYYSQIEQNLRRTASKGLISLLNQQQLENLAFKYFGIKDEYGNIIGYQCPYSGRVYTDYKNIVLEHIVPVVSNGGTVLFNCVPTSKEVNGTNQKGAKHLITWWIKSKYWNQEAPLRLEKIVNYMLDAYEQVFSEYTIEEVESSYLEIDGSNLDKKDNLEYSEANENKLLKQAKNNGIHSYLGFILDCINTLENKEICNIDTTDIRRKLTELQDKHIFEDIERYQLFQNIIQKLIVSRIGDDNRSYLTYSLNFDIKKLMDSIKSNNLEEIYNKLNARLQNIERVLKENNLLTIEYFKSLKDISNIDIIYKNNISEEEVKIFLENIKIGIDTKIEIFIEMLNKGNSSILKSGNQETLEGYPNVNLSNFWQSNKDRIKQKLFIELKDNPKYEEARKMIAINEMTINVENQIPIFIEMLNKGNSSILKSGNQETLEGYPNIKLKYFWNSHKERIKQKLFVELKDNPVYDTARELIAINEMTNNVEKEISIFIEMLNKGDSSILKKRTNKTLEGYPNINLSQFWQRHKERIKQKLFIELKDNPNYDMARELIAINEMTINVENQIPIFIEMLNKGNITILKSGNQETLEGYSNIKLSQFWNMYKERIKQKLFIELKDNPNYDMARELIAINEMTINVENQIPIFIEMLNKGNITILKSGNQETLEGYPNIKLKYFWNSHKERIKQKLFIELKDNPTYDTARELIAINEMTNNVENQISIFIEMLNKGDSSILKKRTNKTLEGYPNINLSQFWQRHKERIKQKLFIELKDNPAYDTARELIAINEMTNNVEKQIPIFIEMLNKGNSSILKSDNQETLEGYSNIKLKHFWNSHKEKIKQKLFVELKDDPKYDAARELISINEVENNLDKKIDIFIEMLNKGNSLVLNQGNNETLEGYPNIKLAQFWSNHKERIKQKLFIELKDNPAYDTARKLIEVNNVENNLDKKIDIFIEMLNKGNSTILKSGNQETLEGYPNISLAYFWDKYKERIKQKLFVELKDNSRYDTARKLIVKHEMIINVDKQILIFIEMLNKGNNKIIKQRNQETLEGYPDISLSTFWNRNKERIKQKLFVELKDNAEYNTAREIITINEMQINVDKQIPIFIEMLNKGNNNILNSRNKETLEGYPNIKLAQFWSNHKERIKQKLFVELKDDSQYDTARKLIEVNNVENNLDTKIDIFIEMLNKGNNKIIKQRNQETLEGYSSINLSRFWHNNQTKIKQKLFVELKGNPEYDMARQTVLTHFNVKTYEELEAKSKKGNQLKEDKKIKKELEETIKYLDEVNLTEREQRKMA